MLSIDVCFRNELGPNNVADPQCYGPYNQYKGSKQEIRTVCAFLHRLANESNDIVDVKNSQTDDLLGVDYQKSTNLQNAPIETDLNWIQENRFISKRNVNTRQDNLDKFLTFLPPNHSIFSGLANFENEEPFSYFSDSFASKESATSTSPVSRSFDFKIYELFPSYIKDCISSTLFDNSVSSVSNHFGCTYVEVLRRRTSKQHSTNYTNKYCRGQGPFLICDTHKKYKSNFCVTCMVEICDFCANHDYHKILVLKQCGTNIMTHCKLSRVHYQNTEENIFDRQTQSIKKNQKSITLELKENYIRYGGIYCRFGTDNIYKISRENGVKKLLASDIKSIQKLQNSSAAIPHVLMTISPSFKTKFWAILARWLGVPHLPVRKEVIVTSLENMRPFTFGRSGSDQGEFCRPWGVCCNTKGHIIVSDRTNNRIQVFDQNGRFLFKFGKPGTNIGEFDKPAGIAVNNKNHILVADKDNHRIQYFDEKGNFRFYIGTQGSGEGQFQYPWDVACNSNNLFAVSDSKNHRVQLFNEVGLFINEVRLENKCNPRGITCKPDDSLIVTDFDLHKIYFIDRNMKITVLKTLRRMVFDRPSGVICDDMGNIVISDCNHNRIIVLNSQKQLCYWFGTAGTSLRQFNKPSGVALSPKGQIIVVDFENNRIQVF